MGRGASPVERRTPNRWSLVFAAISKSGQCRFPTTSHTPFYTWLQTAMEPYVLEPTRAARVLDIVLSSQKELVDNVVIQEPLGSSDHNQRHFNIKIKSDKTKVKQCRRDFRKGNYKEIRKRLAHIDWNDKMKNKTATECWNILRGELDSAIDSFVPMKKQGKRSKKKHLSKEAFRKIRHKQNMWRVYKHTGKDQDYVVNKEALNAATNEVRKSKRNFELKLAQNIKSDSKRNHTVKLETLMNRKQLMLLRTTPNISLTTPRNLVKSRVVLVL